MIRDGGVEVALLGRRRVNRVRIPKEIIVYNMQNSTNKRLY